VTIHSRTDFYDAVPDAGLTIRLDEEPGVGNSAPASITFHKFDRRTGADQTIHIIGDWERTAAAAALRWAADRLQNLPETSGT
jgi:hypothetical protein